MASFSVGTVANCAQNRLPQSLLRRQAEEAPWPPPLRQPADAASLPMPENDILFVFRDVYQWKALDELGINAYYTGRAQEAVTIFKHLLDKKLVPTEQTERTKANLGFAQAKLPAAHL